MSGPALLPFVITGGFGAGGIVIGVTITQLAERSRSRQALAVERLRQEQENLLALQAALGEFADQTQILATNIAEKRDPGRVPEAFRFQWVATQRQAKVLAQRVLDDDLRHSALSVIDKLARSVFAEEEMVTPTELRARVAVAVDDAFRALDKLSVQARQVLAGDHPRPPQGTA